MTNIAHFMLWCYGFSICRRSIIMNVSIGERWEQFVDQAVKAGRYGSASEVVREGLRLVEEREAKLTALKAIIDASIAAGGEVTDAQLDDALARQSQELLRQGIGAGGTQFSLPQFMI